MKSLNKIINNGLDAMDSIFTSRELCLWIESNYLKQFNEIYKNYFLIHKSKKKFTDLFYNLIRKSCKVVRISVLEMPNRKNKYLINYIMMKQYKD